MQACRPFPIYTPGGYKKPTSAADVDNKPWINNPASWFMGYTSSHIRTAILEPENNNVTVPIDNVVQRREIIGDVPAGGRNQLAPVLVHYQPTAVVEARLVREWYTQAGLNPDLYTTCDQTPNRTCDEYPFFSSAQASVSSSLMLVPTAENGPQGSDLRQFRGAANGCDITGEYAAGQPAAFLVIPMSKFGLGISQNFSGVPLPSAYVCPDRGS